MKLMPAPGPACCALAADAGAGTDGSSRGKRRRGRCRGGAARRGSRSSSMRSPTRRRRPSCTRPRRVSSAWKRKLFSLPPAFGLDVNENPGAVDDGVVLQPVDVDSRDVEIVFRDGHQHEHDDRGSERKPREHEREVISHHEKARKKSVGVTEKKLPGKLDSK